MSERSFSPAPSPTSAVVVWVLGIAAWALLWDVVQTPVWAVVPALLAVTLGRKARRDISLVGGNSYGPGLVVAGVILAWAALGLSLVEIVSILLGR